MTYRHIVLLALTLISGCSQPAPVPAASARDSAGIRLVDYSGALLADGPRLKLSRVFRVGWRDDEPNFQATVWPTPGQVRVDGSSVIGDYRANQVYLVSSDGQHIEPLGKEGSGPGEYRDIAAILTVGDTVLVQDEGNWRLTRFFQHQATTIRMPPSRCHVVAASGFSGYVALPYCQSGMVKSGWGDASVETWDRAGGEADTLTRVPYNYVSPNVEPSPITQYASLAGLPDGGFVYARSDLPAIFWYSADGALRQVVRWPVTPNEASSGDWAAYEQWFKSRDYREQSPAMTARMLLKQKKQFHGPMPLFRSIYASDDGSVLLTGFTWDALPTHADVFTPTGLFAGRVQLPKRFVPIDLNGDFIIGWEFDSSDVPALSLYRLADRPQREGR